MYIPSRGRSPIRRSPCTSSRLPPPFYVGPILVSSRSRSLSSASHSRRRRFRYSPTPGFRPRRVSVSPGRVILEQRIAELERKLAEWEARSIDRDAGISRRLEAQVDLLIQTQNAFNRYRNLPDAAGLRIANIDIPHHPSWKPAWTIFPLKVFRGCDYQFLKISSDWDDADLLRELSRKYDSLRTVWRKWFSLKSVSSITMVLADHSFIYPQRIGPAQVTPSKNMRLRWFLHHPSSMKGRYEFMQVLTARSDLGIEFVERWQASRITIAIITPVAMSLLLALLYAYFTGDVSGAFTISGYMTSAYSVCLVLVGLLNLVEF
ncbi:hypothetical protein JAAARDRAFT_128216 [Jaapia argillacea MUCL 33604]|uniref:Uncharacterized protein n=1 Tax=Jaapia argillacea MUCL 33604 TaxID=933084 RepID=A0A067Q676_9AGAM|nr:hypothetical protein JAAARDRAFT_128216 [Jaapia argillacea MUCL 33604]